jgi:hypothetical protein
MCTVWGMTKAVGVGMVAGRPSADGSAAVTDGVLVLHHVRRGPVAEIGVQVGAAGQWHNGDPDILIVPGARATTSADWHTR